MKIQNAYKKISNVSFLYSLFLNFNCSAKKNHMIIPMMYTKKKNNVTFNRYLLFKINKNSFACKKSNYMSGKSKLEILMY